MTATIQQSNSSPFRELFTPLRPVTADPAPTGQPQGSNGATGAPVTNPVGSDTSNKGTVTVEEALAGTKHTEISSVSTSAVPGQSGAGSVPGAAPSASVSLGGIVQGEWAVNIMDALLPAAMVAGFYAFGVKLRKSELQMTEKEKQTVAPVMQKCMDSILLNFNNPWSALAWTLGAIYGGKIMEKGLIGWIDKQQEAKQEEALAGRIAAVERENDPAKYDHANQSAVDIMSGNAVVESQQVYTEEDIRRQMKQGKCNREKAIRALNKKFKIAA